MPRLWAASSPSAICFAIDNASLDRNAPPGDAVRERWTFDELQHERLNAIGVFETVNRRDIRMVQRGEDLRFTPETREAIGIQREGRGPDLERDVAIEVGIVRPIDLAHAAGADEFDGSCRDRAELPGSSARRPRSGIQPAGKAADNDVDCSAGCSIKLPACPMAARSDSTSARKARVVAALCRHERGTLRRRPRECGLDDLFDAMPGGRVHHGRVRSSPVVILRYSQPFAMSHSRVTVDRETVSTSATSASVRPPKYRSSTI